MSGLTRDGAAEAVSRDQIVSCAKRDIRDKLFSWKNHFPCSADHEQEYWQNLCTTGPHGTTNLMSRMNGKKTHVQEGGCRFMAAWVREEENASNQRQKKRDAEEADKVEVAPGVTVASLRRFRTALIGPTQGLPKRRRLCH